MQTTTTTMNNPQIVIDAFFGYMDNPTHVKQGKCLPYVIIIMAPKGMKVLNKK